MVPFIRSLHVPGRVVGVVGIYVGLGLVGDVDAPVRVGTRRLTGHIRSEACKQYVAKDLCALKNEYGIGGGQNCRARRTAGERACFKRNDWYL